MDSGREICGLGSRCSCGLGDSVAEVVTAALDKFGNEPIHVARKGAAIRRVHYAFLAHEDLNCWKYTVGEDSYPIMPVTLVGRKGENGCVDTRYSFQPDLGKLGYR